MKCFVNKKYGAKVPYEPGFTMNMVAYTKGEIPFELTTTLLITKDEGLMENVNSFIDDTMDQLDKIKDYLKSIIGNKADPKYSTLKEYLDYHLDTDNYSDEDREAMFGFCPKQTTEDYMAMLDEIQIIGLTSDEDGYYKKQVFIIDVGFDPDEMFSIFFDENRNILHAKIKS